MPTFTPDCITYPDGSDVLVFATGEMVGPGAARPVQFAGFEGDIRPIMPELSRGVAFAVEPAATDAKYVVLWDGGAGESIEKIIGDLF